MFLIVLELFKGSIALAGVFPSDELPCDAEQQD